LDWLYVLPGIIPDKISWMEYIHADEVLRIYLRGIFFSTLWPRKPLG
jgi:hypothetical protein